MPNPVLAKWAVLAGSLYAWSWRGVGQDHPSAGWGLLAGSGCSRRVDTGFHTTSDSVRVVISCCSNSAGVR
jgi:hypothetical protein